MTSQNAVQALALKVKILPADLQIAVVGSSTAQAVLSYFNRNIDRVPHMFDADSLAHLFHDEKNQKIFLPQSNLANPNLKNKLEKFGNHVTAPVTYQTIKGTGGINLLEQLARKQIDAITFASPSAVTYFVERFQEEGGNLNTLAGICIACMGHVTKKTAKENGFEVNICSPQHTVEGLIQAMSEYFS